MSTNIMSASPLDQKPKVLIDNLKSDNIQGEWKPSQFNVQAVTDEGWLLLWNSYSGKVNSFPPSQKSSVLDLISHSGTKGKKGGIKNYLEKRGFLIPAQVNEMRRVRFNFGEQQHRTDALEFILLASEDCNFRCGYCYEDFEKGTMLPEVRQGVKNLALSRISNLERLSVWWFGGEPLYGMEAIDDLAPYLLDLCEREGVEYYSNMTTNGYLLTPDVVDKLLRYKVSDFQVTIDGIKEDHDRNRPGRDGQSTYETILNNLRLMAQRPERSFSVTIRVNYDRANLPRIEEFLNAIHDDFKDDERFEVSFHAVGQWGGDNDANLDVCGIVESHDAKAKLLKAAQNLGLAGSARNGGLGSGVGSEVCYAVRPYNLIVGATGRLMKCTIDLDKHDRNIVGQLHPDGTLDIDIDKMAIWTEPAFESDKGCQSCHIVAACQGVHCPKIRFDTGESPCPPLRRTSKQRLLAYFEESRRTNKVLASVEAK